MLRVAVAGAGNWGPNLIRVFDALPDATVVEVCDIDPAKLDALSQQYPRIVLTTSYDEMLARSDVDAVVIAAPPSLHFKMAQLALQTGRHCFVEKPLTLASDDAKTLIHLAEDAGKILMVGHTFEYNAAVRWIKDYIDSGELGEVYHIISQRMNFGIIRSDVDAIWNLAPHDISIAGFWLDGLEPSRVRANAYSYLQKDRKIYDFGELTLEYANDTVVKILVNWLTPEKIRKSTIIGSKKMIVFDDVAVESKVKVFDKEVHLPEEWNPASSYGDFQLMIRSGDVHIPRIDSIEPLRNECGQFVDCIRKGRRPQTDGWSGYRVVRVLEAAAQSISRDGAAIELSPTNQR